MQQSSNHDKEGEITGRNSDASYHKERSNRDKEGTSVSGANGDPSYYERLNFQSLAAEGLSVDYTLAVEGANAGLKLLSTRKPHLQNTGGSAAAPG
jgi:hypothetical protein